MINKNQGKETGNQKYHLGVQEHEQIGLEEVNAN